MKTAIALTLLMSSPAMAQDIFVLGEVHDNPLHHLEQAARISAIRPTAVVFEMLSPEQAAQVNAADPGDPELGTKIGWEEAGWPDFAIYAPVFAVSRNVYGAAVARDDLMGAIGSSAADVFGADAAAYGLADLDADTRAEMEQEQADAHCGALPAEMLPGMVEAQRLRDAVFARTALQALADTGGPVVVIAGAGHARTDRGIPAVIAKAAPEVEVFALGMLEEAEPDAPFDEVIVTDPVDREDPCLAFR